MYEVYLGDEGEETEAFSAEKEKEKQREQVGRGLVVDWDRIMPIACRWLNPPGSTQSPASTPAPTAAPTPATIQRRIRLPFSIPQLRIPGTGRRRTTSSSASVPLGPISAAPQTSHSRTSVMSTEKPPLTPEPPEEKVRVAVLISMPFSDPSRKRKSVASTSTTEAELPYVEFGTAEVPAGGLSSILEAPAASPLEQIAVPPPVAGSHMNV
ncbi:hypothetical protein BD310DRAFT_923084 [Dichomitus squalens]|uniref:Uncharacterized protein n=1 Tax=Dichomitus squalens TaxID=114155 RepID=A0A4Q9PZJ3_9APHY|nr:hypothetical protein BD310DRAFT_923084 [Dichomitus squalens]